MDHKQNRKQDLTGLHIGFLEVLGRSEKRGPRGKRTVPLWECRCDCGNITYKATDTLTNPDVSMCRSCADRYGPQKARAAAGFVSGTQISRITNINQESKNLSGFRGVHYEKKTNRYRARIKFQGKLYSLGSYKNLEDAIEARKAGEEKYFGAFLDSIEAERSC